MYTLITTVERKLRKGTNTQTNVLQTLYGTHTLTGDELWTATVAVHQQVNDQWLHITAVDGVAVSSRYLAIIDNGIRYNGQLTQSMPPPPDPPHSTRTHLVADNDTLYSLANAYGATAGKIATKYLRINEPVGNNPKGYIQKGWVLLV